ncbi:hypothetical protein Y032_0054g2522 [Ancylostoma ceylanicum]|uniref:Tudor domain-containing protein n=1 Tax=Ancylostoma ceylanicum TaxID=53326 RepID=A0A016U804_9BILA|nr:hypothetical protein Y032_0054g2522 [Ancylostoma ceylanicum]
MYHVVLGKNDTVPSTFAIQGLPPLEIKVGKEGYFDGFIASAAGVGELWLASSFDERNAIIIATRLFQHQPLKQIQRGALAIVRLQYGNSSKTWTRVVVEGRPDPTHAQVYLLDYGTRQLVNARSLYEMPIEMRRFPPQAFPVVPKMSALPDLGPGEWEKLTGVRITVRLKAARDDRFVGDQLTVYDATTHTDLDFGAALRSGVELERANFTVAPSTDEKHFLLGPQPRLEPSKGPPAIAMRPEQRDFSVLLVCVFGILMAMASIMIVVGFTYKRIQVDRERRRRNRGTGADYHQPQNDAVIPPWSGGDERNPQQTSALPSTFPVEAGKHTENNLGSEEKPSVDENKANSILALSPKAIAAIAALMGSSSAIIDKQLSRTIAIGTGQENSVEDTSYNTRARLGAGSSDISSIKASSSEAIPGFVTSTPVEKSSEQTSSQSTDSNEQSSETSTSSEYDYTKAITTQDMQRILWERALARGQNPSELDVSSISSFFTAASLCEHS